MTKQTAAAPKIMVGLDLGDRYSDVVVRVGGEVRMQARVETTAQALRRRFEGLERSRIVLEVGTHSPWVSRLLEELGHEVIVASAGRVREMIGHGDKTDALDARSLAQFGAVAPELLRPIRHRGPQAQRDLAVIRARETLVRARTTLVNHVRGSAKSLGERIGASSTAAFVRRARQALSKETAAMQEPLLASIEQITVQIRVYDRRIEELCTERYPVTARLRQIKGVGAVTALGFVLTLEDPHRFAKSRMVGAYLGLRPRKYASGDRDPELGISKRGDGRLRRLLVQAAHYILGPFGPDTDLRRWGLRLAAGSKRAKKRAIVAVARKLAVLLHRLWLSGADYEPLRQAEARAVAVA